MRVLLLGSDVFPLSYLRLVPLNVDRHQSRHFAIIQTFLDKREICRSQFLLIYFILNWGGSLVADFNQSWVLLRLFGINSEVLLAVVGFVDLRLKEVTRHAIQYLFNFTFLIITWDKLIDGGKLATADRVVAILKFVLQNPVVLLAIKTVVLRFLLKIQVRLRVSIVNCCFPRPHRHWIFLTKSATNVRTELKVLH